MNKLADKALCESFPILYRQRDLSMQETCMCWGFECGDGWYDILYDLSSKIEALNKTLPDGARVEASQVKEKYGTLRFYTDEYGLTEEQSKQVAVWIREAEAKSEVTCEHCAAPGVLLSAGWCMVRCAKCAKPERLLAEIEYLRKELSRVGEDEE